MGKMINGFEKSFFKNLLMFALLCSLLATMTGCGGDAEAELEGVPVTPTEAKANYTVMVYMVGSDLERGKDKTLPIGGDNGGGAATSDLEEMMKVGSTDNLNVVVQTGGATRWLNPSISGTSVQRWEVNKGSLTLEQDLGNLNMGDPYTLQDFITWAVENYPADRYALVLWDHGAGAIGLPHPDIPLGTTFGSDENHDDGLSLPEIRQALQNAYNVMEKKFELIGFDACLMATLETAYTISPFADYMVASEEIEPGHGWDYEAILSAIASDPDISGNLLGQAIAIGYKDHAEEIGDSIRSQGDTYYADKGITLSVIDLSKVNSAITALESLAEAAGDDLQAAGHSAWVTIAEGRSEAEGYGEDERKESYFDMVDLKNLAQNLMGTYPTEALNLIVAVNEAVIYKIKGETRPDANGLSVFLPFENINSDNVDLTDMLTAYTDINFSTKWRNFVYQYSGMGDQDYTKPTFGNVTSLGNVYSVQVQGDDNDVDDVYAVITKIDPATGTVLILGTDSVEDEDIVNGVVSYEWMGKWVRLNGNLVSMILDDEDEEVTTYAIPALLDGEGVDILVMVENATGNYTILGAWPGTDDGMAVRNIEPIEEGDQITPLFRSYNLTTNEWEYVSETVFTVGASGLQLSLLPLPSDTYYLGFVAEDYAQNEENSDFVAVTVP